MEQVVKILLKRQGIENIGIINQEMNIWVYVKDNIIHFCKGEMLYVKSKCSTRYFLWR